MAREFKVGDIITLEDLYTSERMACSITSRDGERATLKTRQGKIILARIRRVKWPNAECLDATGYNAVFSHGDLRETGDSWEWRKGRPKQGLEEIPCGRGKLKGADIPKIKLMLDDGMTFKTIAIQFGVAESTMFAFIKKHNVRNYG